MDASKFGKRRLTGVSTAAPFGYENRYPLRFAGEWRQDVSQTYDTIYGYYFDGRNILTPMNKYNRKMCGIAYDYIEGSIQVMIIEMI